MRDCWIDTTWNDGLLEEMVGLEMTECILQKIIVGREGLDILISKLATSGQFSTGRAWVANSQLLVHEKSFRLKVM